MPKMPKLLAYWTVAELWSGCGALCHTHAHSHMWMHPVLRVEVRHCLQFHLVSVPMTGSPRGCSSKGMLQKGVAGCVSCEHCERHEVLLQALVGNGYSSVSSEKSCVNPLSNSLRWGLDWFTGDLPEE
eukprot:1143655-Pelagomonas_calceolata.AAC.2